MVDYRIIWGAREGGPSGDAVATGRRAVEALLERAGPGVVWAEVFDERRRAVARQARGRRGLTGYPAAQGWGHVCTACRTLAGQTFLFARPHARLQAQDDTGRAVYSCRNCAAVMGAEHSASVLPPLWDIRVWPDMKA
jgi:hypothetical protein